MDNTKFSLETDMSDDKKRNGYRDRLFLEVQSTSANVRKEARKNIERLYNKYGQTLDRTVSRKHWRLLYEKLFSPEFLSAQITEYYKAKNVDVKQSIVSSLYFPMLTLMPDHLPLVVDFLCDVATQPSGNVRKAAVSLGTWIGFGVGHGVASFEMDYHPGTHKSIDTSLSEAKQAHLQLIEKIQELILQNDIGYPKPWHWADLKSSVYKSLYMLLEVVTRCWSGYADSFYKKESGIDPDDPNLDFEKVLYVDDRFAPKDLAEEYFGNSNFEETLDKFKEQTGEQQYIWDEKVGVISGQLLPDGVFLGTGAGGVDELLRYYCYIPWDQLFSKIKPSVLAMIDGLSGHTPYLPGLEGIIYESGEHTEEYVFISLLVPSNIPSQQAVDDLLVTLYKHGVPIKLYYYLTNTKKPTDAEAAQLVVGLDQTCEELDIYPLHDTACFDFVLYTQPPVHSEQTTQYDKFLDRPRIQNIYFEVVERLPVSSREAASMLRRVMVLDLDFLDTYSMLSEVYGERRAKKACTPESFTSEAYRRACLLISDKNGNWPKEMPWAWLENRHIMRALADYAYLVWERRHSEIALDIFRRLLAMNSNDNQGARYEILALRLGFDAHWHKKFEAKNAPAQGLLDAREIDDWFITGSKKFPEEFKVFWDYIKKQENQ